MKVGTGLEWFGQTDQEAIDKIAAQKLSMADIDEMVKAVLDPIALDLSVTIGSPKWKEALAKAKAIRASRKK